MDKFCINTEYNRDDNIYIPNNNIDIKDILLKGLYVDIDTYCNNYFLDSSFNNLTFCSKEVVGNSTYNVLCSNESSCQ